MMTEARLGQFANALSPILLTLAGMVMLVRLVQALNAICPILTTG
jgi:hypothetical protein